MGVLKLQEKEMSFLDYLAYEQKVNKRYDFYYGELYDMAGGTIRHNDIILNIVFLLRSYFKKKNAR